MSRSLLEKERRNWCSSEASEVGLLALSLPPSDFLIVFSLASPTFESVKGVVI